MPRKPSPRANPSGRKKRDNAMDSGNLQSRSGKSRLVENILYRCSPQLLPPVMKHINENDEQKGYVGEIGFGSFLSMSEFEMNKALTVWLVDKFNCDTEALEFEDGISIPVRPLVKSVLGIPSGPIQVVEGPDVDEDLYNQYTGDKCDGKNVKKVAEEMRSITEKEPFCIAFMMTILRIYLAPKTSFAVNRSLLGAVKQVDKLKEMDWCNFVATYLFKGLKEFKESNATFVHIKGCLHILSVIFIDFVKHAAFEVPVGFPRLGVVTEKHIKWVVSHPFTTLMVRRPEESIYAAVLDNMPKDNIDENGKCLDSETNTDALTDKSATTDTDQNNNKHPVSAELGTAITSPNTTSWAIVEHLELGTSPRSAAPGSLAGHSIFPRSGEQSQSSTPSSEPYSAQMNVSPHDPKGMNSGSTWPMENAGDRSAKKARVDRPSSGQAKRTGGVAAVDLSVLNCSLCCHPLKPPVFQCNGGHLACRRCLAELPGEQCQTCKHGGGFGPNLAMDAVIKLARVECSHDGCKSSVPYYELDDHESACPHAPCYCTEPSCGFVGPPPVLLGHLADVHKVHYGEVHQLQVLEPRCLLQVVGDDSAFLLALGALGMASIISAVCIRAGASPLPQYAVKLWANGSPPPSSAAGSILLDMKVVTSSTRPGDVAVEELPSFLMVPPAYLVGLGASKVVTLDIRIDRL